MYGLSYEDKNNLSRFIVEGAPAEWLTFAEDSFHK